MNDTLTVMREERRWRRLSALLALLLLMLAAGPSRAQGEVDSLAQMSVELWPDYDQPSLLVLLTGTLSPATARPASVTLPVPAGATIHAVARVTAEGGMIDDIEWSETGDRLTLTTPELMFRVEYYVPYQQEGAQRQFGYTWLSPLAIEAFQLRVQQPTFAVDFTASGPSAVAEPIISTAGGFQYRSFPIQRLEAGQPYAVEVSYELSPDQLSASTVADSAAQAAPATGPAPSTVPFDWSPILILLAGAVGGGAIAGALLLWRRGASGRNARRKPRRRVDRPRTAPIQKSVRPASPAGPAAGARGTAVARASYCHNCGQLIQAADDKFCRHCGARLRTTAGS